MPFSCTECRENNRNTRITVPFSCTECGNRSMKKINILLVGKLIYIVQKNKSKDVNHIFLSNVNLLFLNSILNNRLHTGDKPSKYNIIATPVVYIFHAVHIFVDKDFSLMIFTFLYFSFFSTKCYCFLQTYVVWTQQLTHWRERSQMQSFLREL